MVINMLSWQPMLPRQPICCHDNLYFAMATNILIVMALIYTIVIFRYPGGFREIPANRVHEKDNTMVLIPWI